MEVELDQLLELLDVGHVPQLLLLEPLLLELLVVHFDPLVLLLDLMLFLEDDEEPQRMLSEIVDLIQ